MSGDFPRPVRLPSERFDAMVGGDDPAAVSRRAHETAAALLSRVRSDPDPEVVERLVRFTDERGIDDVADLWSRAAPRSLPGALWRIYLIRAMIRQDAELTSYLYQRGADLLGTIDPVVAGTPNPTGPAEVLELADRILRGVFEGDFAVALDRAAAFARVSASGAADVADGVDTTEPERATALTKRAARLSTMADDLSVSSRSWRDGDLD